MVVDAEYARYDVSDLGPTELAQLTDLLDGMEIAHAIELGVLLVFAADELMVDIAIDEIERAQAQS